MTPQIISSSGRVCKAGIAALGVIVLGIGLYSHFRSAWVSATIKIPGFEDVKPYNYCDIRNTSTCPHIALEWIYVSTILITYAVSICGLVMSNYLVMQGTRFKTIDIAYHIVAALCLIAAASVYIVSAKQINEIQFPIDTSKLNFRKNEKLIAGVLTILQGVLYIVTAVTLGIG